nr:DUF6681 family protein [uncultured Ligilactobacillus sp.]
MFTFLDMIRASLNYVNLSTVLKNRIYTILATIGNFYLLYVAIKFYINGYFLRGTLFLLAFIGILYFSYLNLLYYFTKTKKSKIDVSPWIEKKLHLQGQDPMSAAEAEKRELMPGYVQTNGIFKNENFLPAAVVHSGTQHHNIQELAQQLTRMGYLKLDYGGLSEAEIYEKLQKLNKPQKALSAPVALPYFELAQKGNSLVIYGGLNQIERKELATIREVGLLSAREAMKKYQLYLATAVITGGPEKILGRSGLIEKNNPFTLDVQIAYRKKETADSSSQQSRVGGTNSGFSETVEETSTMSRSQHETVETKVPNKHWRSRR